MRKGQFTISNILGVFMILFVLFALRQPIYNALSSAINNSDSIINQLPYVIFPVLFVIVILMLVFYEREPAYQRRVTR